VAPIGVTASGFLACKTARAMINGREFRSAPLALLGERAVILLFAVV
jgi:hypothetical protein